MCQLQVRLSPAALHLPVRFAHFNATQRLRRAGRGRPEVSSTTAVFASIENGRIGNREAAGAHNASTKLWALSMHRCAPARCARVHARRHMSTLRRVGSSRPLRAGVRPQGSSRRRGFHRSRTCSPCRGHRHSQCRLTGRCRASTWTQASAGTGPHLRRETRIATNLRKSRGSHQLSFGS